MAGAMTQRQKVNALAAYLYRSADPSDAQRTLNWHRQTPTSAAFYRRLARAALSWTGTG